MLSILIPTYNYAIDQLVQTIWKQAESLSEPFEIIVLEDNSNDGETLQKNKSITKLSSCHYYLNKENLGRTASRNMLAKRAKYDWLLFLDADVLPVSDTFIQKYMANDLSKIKVAYGGVAYYNTPPEKDKMLRYRYGMQREAKSVDERLKDPYSIISQNLLIDKRTFEAVNIEEKNAYGLDILFSYNLKKREIPVLHIDNPVYHLGLETAQVFLEKSLKSIETTFYLEQQHLISEDTRPVQKAFLKLKKYHAISIFKNMVRRLEKSMAKNLTSKKPSLVQFDMYRLYHYIKLKANA